MFKNVKKALFAFVLLFVALFAIACGKKEANNENCKEFCDEVPTCNNASAETCKDFCPSAPECKEASAETCKKFQDFVAPTSFSVSDNELYVGGSAEVWIDDEAWEPENCDKTLVFVSEDPEIATVDADGVVYGHRPGTVNIKVYSPLNPELDVDPVEFEVKDAEKNDQKVVERELAAILAELPAFITEDTELPEAWNTFVTVTYKVAGNTVELLQVPAGLTADTALKVAVQVTLNDAVATDSVDVWAVLDKNVNTYVVIDSAAALLTNYLAKYVNGAKVDADLELLPSVFGCTINWSSSLATAIDAEGKFGAPTEDRAVTLTAGIRYGAGSKNIDFKVVAKGYTAAEKADEIMASTFGKMEGKSFATSIVLPEFDDKFGAKLSYKSLDTTVYGDDGKLVAAVTEAKDVKFKVTIEYAIAANDADNFVAEKELTIHAIPANSAAVELEALLGLEENKKFQKVVYAPWGKDAGNIVFPALPGMKWDVEAVKLDARLQDEYQVFSQTEQGLKLEAQYLRYQLVSIKGTYTKGDDKVDVVLFFNIGISTTPHNIISAIWRSSAQKDTSLSEIQGKYDTAGNVSYFDKKIGYVTETYGSGYFSGWTVSAERDLGASLTLSKVPGSTDDPAWKCAVAEKIEGADYTGINKLLVTVTGPKDEQLLIKTNDSKEDWVTMTGETLELSIDLAITFDTNKFPMVLFCNPGVEGTGHEFVITKMQLTGADKVIDLLNGTSWRSLDAGVYNVKYSDGKELWQTFMMEVMTVYIREDEHGVYIDPANVNGGIAGAGGNWGVWYVNTTNKPVNIEVGVYSDGSLKYAEGHTTTATIGSRLNIAMDGYALGFVADSTGKIIHGSNNSKLQNGMADKRAVLGGKTYKAGDKVSEAMYNAMQLEGKAEKFDALYTASANLVYEVNENGTYKKVTGEDGAISYVEIAEGETVTEKFAPKYAKNATLTAEQYAELDAANKALVTVEYKAKEAVTYEVPNLFGDSAKGATINYIEIPANGFAMSWKYQFYGVGNPATVYPFCQDGETLKIEHFQVHPLSSMDAEYATNYVVAAEEFTTISEAEYPSVIYKAAENLEYVQNDNGGYKKQVKDGKTTYSAIAEGETVAAADRYAPTYPAGTILTTAQYKALSKDANVTISYFETNVTAARSRYSKLTGDTLADVFPVARLTALEARAAEFLDADITALLASEPTEEGADKSQFAKDLATMWSRLYKTEGDTVVNKISDEIAALLTKKADFDAKYAEYAAIDLHITYDYNGGYIQGFWKDTDKDEFLVLFKTDLYNFMVEQNAWEGAVAPTLETFLTNDYWAENYSKYEETTLTKYLFTPKVNADDTVNENYHDIIEGSTKFINTAAGHKYIALLDFVDESTRSNNMGGQDLWGRAGDDYAQMEWLPKQSYYTSAKWKDLTTYGGNTVKVTNKGASLGAYRFSQWVCGSGHADYKNWIPNNVWSNIFDRQYTQDHNTQIYHCTDLTVKLQDTPYKEGFEFLGWKFEDGKDAVITGSMFADVTVYAAWAPNVEGEVESALKVSLEGVYLGPTAKVDYRTDSTPTGTIADQFNTTGLGKYAFIVGNKFFITGKYAAIELGAGATEDITPTKAELQPYGVDNDTNNSTAIINTADGPKNQDSYGYGALYHNAGDKKVIISDIVNLYGRTISGATYGYNRYLFHYDAEKKAYVGTLLVNAEGAPNTAGISVTMEPGDFLWCPMTAERYCSGLTDRDTAVIGVLKDGIEVQIIDISNYIPTESPEWFTVGFYGADGKLVKEFYPEAGETTKFNTLNFVKNMIVKNGEVYKLLGWATTADATAATLEKTVSEINATADVKYYPVYEKVAGQDTVTLGAPVEALGGDAITSLADAVAFVNAGGTIVVPAGTYKESFTINKSLTLAGPNAEKAGTAADRAEEAVLSGKVSIAANNVTIKGINVTGSSAQLYVGVTSSNILIENNLFNGASPTNVILADYGIDVTDLVIKNNKFEWAKYSYGFRPIRVSKLVTNFEFSNNYLSNDHTSVGGDAATKVTLIDYFYIENAAGTFKINDNNFACVPSSNWLANIRSMADCTTIEFKNNNAAGRTGTTDASGINFMKPGANATLEVSGNTLANMSGTILNLGAGTAAVPVSIKNNVFRCAYKIANVGSCVVTYEGNTYYVTPATTPSDFTAVAND